MPLFGEGAASRQIREGKQDRADAREALSSFNYGQNTQGLANPYAGVTNTFANLSNPAAGLQVGLQAADYQRQGLDQSQANVLDAIAQSGGKVGASATALARQSAQSNQQIAAGIEQQELRNQQLAVQGEAQRQQLVAQGAQRAQQLRGAGEQYRLGLQETRDAAELAGLGNQYAAAQQSINAGYKAKADNKAAFIKGITGLASDVLKAGAGGGAGGGFGFGGN